jgi:hypothetical protein
MRMKAIALAVMAAAGVSGTPGDVLAQGFGIGPRMSTVRGDAPSATPSVRYFGGTVRIRSSRRVAFELAGDYKKTLSADGLTRERERPLQGSLLLFLVRSTFAPYVLGGYGLYDRHVDWLDASGAVVRTIADRQTGAHLGFGAELFVSRHAALFADYRYRFVRFGEPEAGAKEINLPLVDQVKLSHRGTMWTSGVAFYF